MIDINKYIGLPYKQKGYDFDGADCYGLIWLFYKNEFNKILPKYENCDTCVNAKLVESQIDVSKMTLDAYKTNTPKTGDLVLFRFRGLVCHLGLYIDDSMVLHILRDVNAVCEPINHGRLSKRVEGIYAFR